MSSRTKCRKSGCKEGGAAGRRKNLNSQEKGSMWVSSGPLPPTVPLQ